MKTKEEILEMLEHNKKLLNEYYDKYQKCGSSLDWNLVCSYRMVVKTLEDILCMS